MNNNLDLNQLEAVCTDFKHVLICAPPGSGKTTVIINRVNYLINVKDADPRNILVITFTRSSAFDMRGRYLMISKGENIPFFGTFHSLYYNILKKYDNKIKIIPLHKASQVVKDVLLSYMDSTGDEKIREVLNDISFFKNTGGNIKDFKSRLDKTVFMDCFNEYERYKAVNNLMDFDDLQLKVGELFRKDRNILDYYRRTFKYILVDEFQDCDSLQIEILQLLGRSNFVFAVGDEDQCIYSFRGSKPDCMVNFREYFQNGKKLFLKMNYRSTKNIVGMSKNIIFNNEDRNLKPICSSRQEYGKINFNIFPREKEQADYLSKSIRNLVDEGRCKYGDIAVLYRTNVESRILIDSFLTHGIKFKLLDEKYNFYNHFICRDLISYLKLSIDVCDRKNFISIINKPFRYIGRVNMEKIRKNRTRENCFEILKNVGGISIFQLKILDKFQRKIKKLNRIKLNGAVEFILNKLNYIEYLRDYCRKSNRDLEEFQHILYEFKVSCENFDSIEDFLNHVDDVKKVLEESVQDENSVTLSTIHGVKGMEFKNVYIVDCSEGILPHENNIDDNIEEERRLFYVGVTRAVDNLNLCCSSTVRGKSVQVSRFIKECVPYI
ncbi:MAG: ATP-dependent helicase [Clostridiales bacterium]|nr:ATP-dependent helicase [Clostridiales bacterium]